MLLEQKGMEQAAEHGGDFGGEYSKNRNIRSTKDMMRIYKV